MMLALLHFTSLRHPAWVIGWMVSGFLVLFAAETACSGTLDGVEHMVHAGTKAGAQSNDVSGHAGSDIGGTESRDPHTASLVFGFFFHLPHYLIEKNVEYSSDAQFLGYPYEGGVDGYMVRPFYTQGRIVPEETEDGDLLIGGGGEDVVKPAHRSRSMALRLSGEYGYDLETVHKMSGFLLFETRWRVGLEGGYTYFRERLPRGEHDTAGTGDLNLVYRFAQHRRVQMRTGVGGRFMADTEGKSGGGNFTYGVDIYPVNPLVVSFSVDFGNLGPAFVLHGRGQIGAVLRSFELFGGWEVLQVGDDTLHSPLAGLRVWI